MISQLYPATSLVWLVKFPTTFGAAPGDPPCQRLPAEPPEDSGEIVEFPIDSMVDLSIVFCRQFTRG
jgi:hypothetical protein